MDIISTTVWQRRGSSIVFDQNSLGQFIADGSVISLRQMISWKNSPPADPPVPGKTILISGLETVMETMGTQEAEAFLSHRIRPLISDLQNRWHDCGIVFGFTANRHAFSETPRKEDVRFHRRDKEQIHLSEVLWGGSAVTGMKRLVRSEGEKPEPEIIGYYVARIS